MKHDPIDTGATVTGNDLQDGIWTVRLDAGSDALKLEASHRHRTIPNTTVEDLDGETRVTVKLPLAVLSDGLQSVHLLDKGTGITLASLHVAAGEQVSMDMQAELTLLRDELDLLKRGLRALMTD